MFLACTSLIALNKLYIIQNLKPEKSTSMFINYLVNSCGGTQKSTCQELPLTRTASEWFWWKESSTTKEREICLWFCGNYKIMFENGGLETPKDIEIDFEFHHWTTLLRLVVHWCETLWPFKILFSTEKRGHVLEKNPRIQLQVF
jgi:hypothetical protein